MSTSRKRNTAGQCNVTFMLKNGDTLHNGAKSAVYRSTFTEKDILVDLFSLIDARPIAEVTAETAISLFGSIPALLRATHDELRNIGKLSERHVHFILLLRALLSKFNTKFEATSRSISSMRDMHAYLSLTLAQSIKEELRLLLLDKSHNLLADLSIAVGSVSRISVYPREILRPILLHQASAVILAHNHPAGTLAPSKDDVETTHSLQELLDSVDVKLIDHVIVTQDGLYSFRRAGLLKEAANFDSVTRWKVAV